MENSDGNRTKFGFNRPDGIPDEDPRHGYERWISIPDDMDVPAPLTKKHLEGGMKSFQNSEKGLSLQ